MQLGLCGAIAHGRAKFAAFGVGEGLHCDEHIAKECLGIGSITWRALQFLGEADVCRAVGLEGREKRRQPVAHQQRVSRKGEVLLPACVAVVMDVTNDAYWRLDPLRQRLTAVVSLLQAHAVFAERCIHSLAQRVAAVGAIAGDEISKFGSGGGGPGCTQRQARGGKFEGQALRVAERRLKPWPQAQLRQSNIVSAGQHGVADKCLCAR